MPTEPPSIMVRTTAPDDAAVLATLHVNAWVDAYRGLIPDTVIARQTHDRRVTQWQQTIANDAMSSWLASPGHDLR